MIIDALSRKFLKIDTWVLACVGYLAVDLQLEQLLREIVLITFIQEDWQHVGFLRLASSQLQPQRISQF